MIPAFVRDKAGNIYLNDSIRYVKSGVLVPRQALVPLVTPAAPAAGIPSNSPVAVLESPQDAVLEIYQLMGEHDPADAADVQNRLTVQITDNAWRRRLMNRPILANHVFGNNLRTFKLLETILLRQQQTLQLEFQNNSTAGASNFRFSMEHVKFQASELMNPEVTDYLARMSNRKLYLTPWWQTTDAPVTIPAGGTVNTFLTTTRDVLTVFFYSMMQALSTGVAGDLQERVLIRLFDAKTERPLQNQPFTMNTGTGTSQFPYHFATGWCIEPNTKIRAELTNLITDAPTEVFWTLGGVASYVTSPGLLEPGVVPAAASYQGQM